MMVSSNAKTGSILRNLLGGSVGNALEWYDFAVYGYFAPIIGANFFPSEDKLASLISAFSVFAVGYLIRPLGGIFFGVIGDRLGRKKALQISVMVMAIFTTLLGVLPTHAQIGVTASFLLIVIRLVQGFSVGGEFIGSISYITEVAPANKRGFFGSWATFSTIGGVMLGSGIAALLHNVLSEAALHSYGWRIPFLLGILLGIFGLWLRTGIEESPEFMQIKARGGVKKNPLMEVFKHHPKAILHIMCLVMLFGSGFYLLFVWWPTYLSKIVHPPIPHAFGINTISMLIMMALIPLAGMLGDRIGLKKLLVWALGGFIVLTWPLFYWVDQATFMGALAVQLIFAAMMATVQGIVPALMSYMFPAKTRFTGLGIGYNLSLALFGGTAPLICTWLIQKTNDIMTPAYYLIAMAIVSFLAALSLAKQE
ncbi:MAG: MHS family MFS transporter [Desulfobacteraceae bacterium]|nr:MHS family MFS transporter [Desulfobacteraceae bacterium]